MDMNQIQEYIINKSDELNIKKVQKEFLEKNNIMLKEKIKDIYEEIELNLAAALLLKTASSKARVHAIKTCENIVTACLREVFVNEIKFIIKEYEDRKTPQLEFYLTDEFGNESNLTLPTESRGGGVVDIVALGLRIAINQLLYNDDNYGPLVFDEPAKYVSQDYIGNVGIFLKKYSKDFERQIIMVTHDSYLSNIGDNIFAVDKTNGQSQILSNFTDDIIDFTIDN